MTPRSIERQGELLILEEGSETRLDAVVKTVGLIALLTPVFGAVIRMIAFGSARIPHAWTIAAKASVADLTVAGSRILLFAFAFGAFYSLLAWHRARRIRKKGADPKVNAESGGGLAGRTSRALVYVTSTLGWIASVMVLIYGFIFLSGWPTTQLLVITLVTASVLAERLIGEGRLTVSRLSIVALPFLLLFSLGTGLSGAAFGSVDFVFDPQVSATPPDGLYIELLDDGSSLWLHPCDRTQPSLVRVPKDSVLLAFPGSGPDISTQSASVWDVWWNDGEVRVGLADRNCP